MSPSEDYNRKLQEELARVQAEKEAMRKEFENTDTLLDPEDPVATKRQLTKLVPDALNTIKSVLLHGESDAVRMNAAKFVLSVGLGKVKVDEDGTAALKDFIESLKG